MKKCFSLILLFVLFDVFYTHCLAKERIANFHSDIRIDSTGRVEVTETIEFYANRDKIKRGIVRTIPIYREKKDGDRERIDIKILDIYRDGEKEDFRVKSEGDDMAIYIGSSNYILPKGKHQYVLRYESYGHVGFYDGYDEIYWNVTGNGWELYIDKCSATVYLPNGAVYDNSACYTGNYGSSDIKCEYTAVDNATVHFVSNAALAPGSGFTIALAFTPHIIKRPPPPSGLALFWLKYRLYIVCFLILLLLSSYYFLTWYKVGRGAKKKLVVPAFNPPNDWTPAELRYIYKRNVDNKLMSITLLSMAVKGAIGIEKEKKTYTIVKQEAKPNLTDAEEKVLHTLFSDDKKRVEVSNADYTIFSKATTAVVDDVKSKISLKDFNRNNYGYVAVGLALVALCCMVGAALLPASGLIGVLIMTVVIYFPSLLLISMMIRSKQMILKILGGIFIVGVLHWPFTYAVSVVTYLGKSTSYSLSLPIIILNVFIPVSFILYYYLIKATTEKGAQAKADINGFKMYLEAAEENRLNLSMPPEHTTQLFEQMLPYAVALDLENKWARKFDKVLADAGYNPQWYVDRSGRFEINAMTKALSVGLASSYARASVSPQASGASSGSGGWSSGSGGGGFSGGGGGGGGGRGW